MNQSKSSIFRIRRFLKGSRLRICREHREPVKRIMLLMMKDPNWLENDSKVYRGKGHAAYAQPTEAHPTDRQ